MAEHPEKKEVEVREPSLTRQEEKTSVQQDGFKWFEGRVDDKLVKEFVRVMAQASSRR